MWFHLELLLHKLTMTTCHQRPLFFGPDSGRCLHNCTSMVAIYQCCPTLSPFATCGDRSFKCGDRQLFQNESLMINTLHFPKFLTKLSTTRHLSKQLWQMWRQRECGWTPLLYIVYYHFYVVVFKRLKVVTV